jgi:hypothetical protein
MSRLRFTKTSTPSTPAANKSELFIDTADRKLKQIDDNGVISTLNNDGLQDRNLLINGGFSIQQRVAAASTAIPGISTTTRGGQVADRWAVTTSVASNLNWAQIDTSAAPETGLLSRYYGSIISSTAGKKVMISQWVINAEMMHLLGKKVRISIKHNQKVGSGQLYKLGLLQLNASGTVDTSPAFLTGAWSTTTGVDPAWGTNLAAIAPDASPTGENGTITGSYLNITTVATTWTRSSCVFSVPTTAKNLVVVFFSDATGGTTDNISVAEAQMTQGPDIVDYKEAPTAETLIRCQRFFCKSFPLTVVPVASASEATAGSGATGILGKTGSATALGSQITIQFPVQMFKTPTVTYFTPTAAGALVFRLSGTSPAVQGTTASRTNSTTDRGVVCTATNEATTNGAVGDLVGVHYTADAEFNA